MEQIVGSYKIMMQILTKVFGILATIDKNWELHHSMPVQVWATGHYGTTPHFALANSYLGDYIIILICSFLDEYNQQFIPTKCPVLHDRIRQFKTQMKPVLTRINQWSGLKNYRNHILAHNLRLKDNLSIFDSDGVSFNVPNSHDEIVLLGELAALITKNIGKEFPELINQLDFEEKIIDKANVPFRKIDFTQEYKAVCEEIKKLGLTYTQRTRL